jgi:pimeloyl-ACP methyl ester carboxylesterase
MPELERDGAQIVYEAAGERDATPAVYVPGLGGHSRDSLSVYVRAVLSRDYRLIIPDPRGAGRTRVPPGAASSPAQMADDIAAILEAEAIQSAHIFGYSLGTALSLELAHRHPGRVRSLALAGGFVHIRVPSRTSFILEAMRDLRASGAPYPLVNRFNAIYLLSEAFFELGAWIEDWVNGEPDPLTQTADGFTLQTEAFRGFDARPWLNKVTQPVLILSSPDDLLVPPHHQHEMAQGLPQATVKAYPGGHAFVALPPNFPLVMDDLRAFWAETDAVT